MAPFPIVPDVALRFFSTWNSRKPLQTVRVSSRYFLSAALSNFSCLWLFYWLMGKAELKYEITEFFFVLSTAWHFHALSMWAYNKFSKLGHCVKGGAVNNYAGSLIETRAAGTYKHKDRERACFRRTLSTQAQWLALCSALLWPQAFWKSELRFGSC